MGKGDKRTKRGKIWRGTFGKTRPRKKSTARSKAKGGAKGGRRP
jgi:30S ribosomal protein S31